MTASVACNSLESCARGCIEVLILLKERNCMRMVVCASLVTLNIMALM